MKMLINKMLINETQIKKSKLTQIVKWTRKNVGKNRINYKFLHRFNYLFS